MPYRLISEEKSRYENDGYLVRESVFSPAEVVDLRAAAERAAACARGLAATGRTYVLDGNRFVDSGASIFSACHQKLNASCS